jgi:hypothetical protein
VGQPGRECRGRYDDSFLCAPQSLGAIIQEMRPPPRPVLRARKPVSRSVHKKGTYKQELIAKWSTESAGILSWFCI